MEEFITNPFRYHINASRHFQSLPNYSISNWMVKNGHVHRDIQLFQQKYKYAHDASIRYNSDTRYPSTQTVSPPIIPFLEHIYPPGVSILVSHLFLHLSISQHLYCGSPLFCICKLPHWELYCR